MINIDHIALVIKFDGYDVRVFDSNIDSGVSL